MSVTTQRKDDDPLPDAESRDWGDYGVVIIETGNTGGWVLEENGNTVDLSEMR